MMRNSPQILRFFLLSTDQKIKTQNTIPLHTLAIRFVIPPSPPIFSSHFDFLSVGLFLSHFSLSAVMHSLIHAPVSLDAVYSLLCIRLSAAAASLLPVVEICTHTVRKQNNMQMLRLHARSTVPHMHTVLALKFNAGRNHELLPQVSTEKTTWRCTFYNSCSM